MTFEAAPSRVGEYRVLEKLGEGGMAEVFLAVQVGEVGAAKRVVLKRMHPRFSKVERLRAMFFREARLAARLRHTNVVQVFGLLEEEGEPWMVMEHLEGLSWREVARRTWAAGRSLPLAAVVRGCADAASGLHHAHQLTGDHGGRTPLIHRDISPDNIFLVRDGTTKVLDFGIAKATDAENLTQTAEVKGKLPFMSPEMVRGEELTPASDLWALGVTLFWLVTGERPFVAPTDAMLGWAILKNEPLLVRDLNVQAPAELIDVINALLCKDPAGRPASALDVFEQLTGLFPEDTRNRDGIDLIARTLELPDTGSGQVRPTGPASLPPSSEWEPTAVGDHHAAAPSTVESAPPSAVVNAPTLPAGPRLFAAPDAATQVSHPRLHDAATMVSARRGADASTASLADAATQVSRSDPIATDDTVRNLRTSPDLDSAATVTLEADTDVAPAPRFERRDTDLADAPTLRRPRSSPGRRAPVWIAASTGVVVTCVVAWLAWPGAKDDDRPLLTPPDSVDVPEGVTPPVDTPRDPRPPSEPTPPEPPPPQPTPAAPDDTATRADPPPEGLAGDVIDDDTPDQAEPEEAATLEAATASDATGKTKRVSRGATVRVHASVPTRWFVAGRRSPVATANGEARLPKAVRSLTAVDRQTGGKHVVPVKDGVADLDLVGDGTLDIVVLPWADVTLGGRALGKTPLDPLRVRAGRYNVKLKWKDVERVVPVDVPVGGTGRLRVDLRR